MLEIPVVVLASEPRRRVHPVPVLGEPGVELPDRHLRLPRRRQEFRVVCFELPDQVLVPGDGPGGGDFPVGMAVADPVGGHQVPQRQHGQLAAGIREVVAGERQEGRNAAQLGFQGGKRFPGQRELPEREPLHRIHVGPGVPRPGTPDPQVEIQAVRSQPVREVGEAGPLALDGCPTVVRKPVLHGRAVELEELVVEGDECRVVAGASRHAARGGGHGRERKAENGSPPHREPANAHGEAAPVTRSRRKSTKSPGGRVPVSRAATRCRQAPS